MPARDDIQNAKDVSEARGLIPSVATDFIMIAAATRARDWRLCERTGERALGIGYSGLLRARVAAAEMSRRAAAVQIQSRGAVAILERLASNAGDDSKASKALLKQLQSQARLLDRIAREGLPTSTLDAWGRANARWAIAGMSRGLLALVHSSFNLGYAEAEPDDVLAVPVHRFKDQVEQFRTALDAQLAAVYAEAAAGRASESVAAASAAAVAWIEQALLPFTRQQARAAVAMRRLHDEGKGADTEKMGALAADAGGLTRDALAAHAAAAQLATELLAPHPMSECQNLRILASRIPFHGEMPQGKRVELKQLKATAADVVIETEGLVIDASAARMGDGKLVSRLTLLDASSRKQATVAGVFAHLPHAGVVQGSYCRLRGRFHASSALLEGAAGVEIDRLDLTELAARSWRVALIRSARPWFHRWRNGLDLDWSLAPHLARQDGEPPAPLGANELIFLPLLRS